MLAAAALRSGCFERGFFGLLQRLMVRYEEQMGYMSKKAYLSFKRATSPLET